ncbi:MAG: hypothetical protein ACXVEF_33635 [Polyangiales bacterium]
MPPSRLVGVLLFVLGCAGCELAYPTHETSESSESDAAADSTLVIPGPCKPPGLYCGNDKVPGDPNVLYQCVDGGDAKVHERCEAGCKIAPPGVDDYCK